MQKVRHQGSIGGGIALLVVGTLLLALVVVLLINYPRPAPSSNDAIDSWIANQIYDSSYRARQEMVSGQVIVSVLFGILGSAVCLIGGAFMLKNGIVGKKVMEHGTKSICTVVSYRKIWRRRGGPIYNIEFSYKGDSGEYHTISADVSVYRIDEPAVGNKYHCTVYQEDCYIDFDNFNKIEEEQFE